jgi:hypothetical protein
MPEHHSPMNQELAALLTLLKAGLWEKELDELSLFPLSYKSWENVFYMAQCQTVTGIVWQGICRLPENLLPPETLLLHWVAKADAIERKNRKMNDTLIGLYGMFQKNGLHPVLQKGQGVALLYEHPLLRECGDIDFYFPIKEERQYAASLVQERGCKLQGEADGSIHYVWNGTTVEHHPRLLDISNPFKQKRSRKPEHDYGFYRVSLSTKNDIRVTVPSPVLDLLLLNVHIMKHAFGWGVGLRQLCDMARACYSFHDIIDSYEIQKLYHDTGIGKWSRLLHSFLTDYLGLPAACLPYEEKSIVSTPLLDIIVRGGNFGQHAAGHRKTVPNIWKRKINTSRAFLEHTCFSYRYAPQEAFWTFINLLMGQNYVKRLLFPSSGIYL